jgi:hypothetical protein
MLQHILHHANVRGNDTKQTDFSSDTSDLYLGVWFEYWPTIMKIYGDFPSFPGKCLDNIIKLGHDIFLTNPFQ